ncbi:flavo protein, partial [Protomyces lactucae-debilis]
INLVVGCTGSIAAIKVPELVRKLHATGKFNIILLPSNDSLHFFNLQDSKSPNALINTLDSGLQGVTVFKDEDEYRFWRSREDPVLHIEIRRWADILLIAPLSADTLAKINSGRCDTLLLEVLRAWDYTQLSEPTPAMHHTKTHATQTFKQSNTIQGKKLIACPAMNTHMFTHPLTAGHLQFLQETLRFELLGPIEKRLACGDLGTGGMGEVNTIV